MDKKEKKDENKKNGLEGSQFFIRLVDRVILILSILYTLARIFNILGPLTIALDFLFMLIAIGSLVSDFYSIGKFRWTAIIWIVILILTIPGFIKRLDL